MSRPEWSPNESYLNKFERLAFALVRTRPPQQQTYEHFKRTIWADKVKGLAGPFALALLVSIPYVAENSSGPIIVASLLLSAVDACLTVWCFTDFESQHGHCPGDLFSCLFNCVGEFPAFLVGWWWIAAQSAAFAAAARNLSSIMDSVTGRHIATLMENTLGTFTPMGAPVDLMALSVTAVPTIMVALGMEESNFLRWALFGVTSLTTGTIFTSALATSHLFPTTEYIPIIPDRNLYAKILSGAALASVGFLGLYTISKPDNLTLTQHQHFQTIKRFSLTGCVVCSSAFLLYFIQSTVLNKVQQTPRVWDGDPPLLWQLSGGWRLAVASLSIAALALVTFEFLIPMCVQVTKMANDGLLYRKLRKDIQSEDTVNWRTITPIVFGGVSSLQAILIDTKVLVGLVASCLMCIHIVVCSSMLVIRYQSRPCPPAFIRSGQSRTRPRIRNSLRLNAGLGTSSTSGASSGGSTSTRRMLTVSFLKNGLTKIPRDVYEDSSRGSACATTETTTCNDRTFLMDDVGITPMEPRESTSDFSMGSGVSGYESDSEPCQSEATDDTDIDAAVSEYQERIRVATLNGAMPMSPTPATARRVALATTALIPCCLALSASLNRAPRGHITGIMLAISSGLLTFLLLVVISRQPQRRRPAKLSASGPNYDYESSLVHFLTYSVVPWLPAAAIFLHCCLLLEGVDLAGTPFAFWLATGLIIYFSYGVVKSVASPPSAFQPPNTTEHGLRCPINEPVRQSVVCAHDPCSTATTSSSVPLEPYAQIDTIIIP